MIELSFSAWCLLPAVLALLLLPLLPVIRQWQTPRNVPPLEFPAPGASWDAEAGDAMARTRDNFQTLIAHSEKDGVIRGAHTDGIAFMVLGPRDHLSEQLPPSTRRLRVQVISARHLDVPGELICDRLLYATARLNIAHHAVVKHALAGREAVIGSHARVRRWLRAENRIDAAEAVALLGTASAGREIVLSRRCRFERLLAPSIRFGRTEVNVVEADAERILPMQAPNNVYAPGDGRWLCSGDLSIAPGHRVNARLVVDGNLFVGTGARLAGDVHVKGDLIMHHDAVINGAITCDGNLRLGDMCRIRGPVRVRGALSAGDQTVFGSPAQTTTVIAREIRAQEGCTMHGAVWAQRRGEVVAERGTRPS